MRGMEYAISRKDCSIDLVQQKIRIENAYDKFSKQIDKLIKQD